MLIPDAQHWIVIACGGTGGHLFPGLAVAREMVERNWAVSLLVSPKQVDQRAVQSVQHLDRAEVVTLPTAAFQAGNRLAFWGGFIKSCKILHAAFKARPPTAVLAMGGFTGLAPVLVGKRFGARTFLHESNVVPGRANRFLARFVDEVFLGFAEAADRLSSRKCRVTGTPVRAEFRPRDQAECQVALGLEPGRPTVLVMGGSQGASAINDLVIAMVPDFSKEFPAVQWVHLTGPRDLEKVKAVYAHAGAKAVVTAFCDRMHFALSAATLAISRAGASALAELAAVQLPAILIPYPEAAGNHQLHNARAFGRVGAAIVLQQYRTGKELATQLAEVGGNIRRLIQDTELREKMRRALAQLHKPQAARDIVDAITRTAVSTACASVRTHVSAPTPASRQTSPVP